MCFSALMTQGPEQSPQTSGGDLLNSTIARFGSPSLHKGVRVLVPGIVPWAQKLLLKTAQP